MLTLRTLCESLQTLWVCHPHKLQRADLKALQLAEASKAGLKTPNTLISELIPAKAAAFVDQLEGTECAIKPLIPLGVQNEEEVPPYPLRRPCRKITRSTTVRVAPTIFQPYIDKEAELRCVVIGEKIFSARIDSQVNEDTRKDWRGGEYQLEPFSLPEQVEASISALDGQLWDQFCFAGHDPDPRGRVCVFRTQPQWAMALVRNQVRPSSRGEHG